MDLRADPKQKNAMGKVLAVGMSIAVTNAMAAASARTAATQTMPTLAGVINEVCGFVIIVSETRC